MTRAKIVLQGEKYRYRISNPRQLGKDRNAEVRITKAEVELDQYGEIVATACPWWYLSQIQKDEILALHRAEIEKKINLKKQFQK
jgi:hypothetical protein